VADYPVRFAADDVHFRLLTCADLPAVLNIERTSYSFPWSEAVFADCMKAGYECWGGYQAGELLGYGIMQQILDEVHLLNLCVAPRQRGRGVARLLLRQVIVRSRQQGAVTLGLEVRASNLAARELYASEGFMETGVRPDYYPDSRTREDAHILSLPLT